MTLDGTYTVQLTKLLPLHIGVQAEASRIKVAGTLKALSIFGKGPRIGTCSFARLWPLLRLLFKTQHSSKLRFTLVAERTYYF